MEKRLVVFVILSLLIILGYPFFIEKITGQSVRTLPKSVTDKLEQAEKALEAPDHIPHESDNPGSVVSSDADGFASVDVAAVVDGPESEAVVESDLFRIHFSSRGGVITRWELKEYVDIEEDGSKTVVQLVPAEMSHFPLSLIIPGESDSSTRQYQFDVESLALSSGTPEATLVMSYQGDSGKRIKKEITFSNSSYRVGVKILTEGYRQAYDLSLGTNFGLYDGESRMGQSAGGIALVNNEVLRESAGDMEQSTVSYDGRPAWFGLQDKYYLAALIPEGDVAVGAVTFKKEGEKEISAQIRLAEMEGPAIHAFSLYAGPKEYDRLNSFDVNLDESIDFGWFIFGSLLPVRLIAKPIFYLLRFFYSFTNNYGIAIIMVTVLIKALFFPITQKSMKSMKSMSGIQPKIAALKKKYKNNKEKMNLELMSLYKTEKVNPLGGCLPMLAQIPVFISLYNILYTTIDLRQAPFFLWVTDLSLKDPFYVLPIVMGATMFLQQYTQPSAMDSTQSKVMMFLPAVYTFMFLQFPSGLVLYWLVNNSLTILQQQFTNRQNTSGTPALSK